MGSYAIKDLAYLSGVKAHTIRIWEQRYNIITPQRSSTNIRTYSDYDLRMLLNISFLNKHGHKISKIAKLSYEQIADLVDKIAISSNEHNTQIASLILAMVNLDEAKFNQVLTNHILENGFESATLNVIFPFLERVGILWQTGDINPAHEHFISSLIRQKLLAAIDLLPLRIFNTAARVLLFLPEGEWHELGLLYAYYTFKKRGYKVLYLGQSLPYQDLKNTVELFRPQLLVSSITTIPAADKTLEFAKQLASDFKNSKIMLSGAQVLANQTQIQKYAIVLNKIPDLNEWLIAYEKTLVNGQKNEKSA